MTTDERLERLIERHEALTQSVESLLVTTKEHSQQITELMNAAASLLHVAQIHEQRISDLEGTEGDELTH